MVDTHVTPDPTTEALVEMVELAANEVRAFGLEPKVAFLSHSHFGASDQPSAVKMREAVQLLSERNPKLEVEGEMQADPALSEPVRSRRVPSPLPNGIANLLGRPALDAANIPFQLIKTLAHGS